MKKLAPLVLTLITLPVVAQTSFRGISLNTSFPGAMNKCPTRQEFPFNAVDFTHLNEVGICFFKEDNGQYSVYNTPSLGIRDSLKVETYKDKPLVFTMNFGKTSYTQAVNIFEARFGKPTKASHEVVRTKAGDAYDSRSTIWYTATLSIQLNEIGNNVNWSDGVIVNMPLLQKKFDDDRDAAKSAASRL